MQAEARHDWLNGGEAFDYMNSVENRVVRNLLHLVHHALLVSQQRGMTPSAPFDLLYCFRLLHEAFENTSEVAFAVQGNELGKGPPDWI